jgi:hypothetical protein
LFPACRSTLPAALGALALALAACPGNKAKVVADGGQPEAPDAGAGAADASPPALKLEVRYQTSDAGLALVDFAAAAAAATIEPTSQLEVSTNIGLQNYRIRLFDEVDRVVVSDDQMEEPGDKVLYRIQLPTPLKPGHKYALVVDAQAGSAIADSAGRLYPDQRLELVVAGAREPDPPPRRKVKPKPGAKPKVTRRRR